VRGEHRTVFRFERTVIDQFGRMVGGSN